MFVAGIGTCLQLYPIGVIGSGLPIIMGVSFTDVYKRQELELDYITAVPRMALYMKCSTEIYNIYLKYVAPEDIHVYSIDEVFMDVTDYLNTYRMTARELAGKIIREIQQETSIAATA